MEPIFVEITTRRPRRKSCDFIRFGTVVLQTGCATLRLEMEVIIQMRPVQQDETFTLILRRGDTVYYQTQTSDTAEAMRALDLDDPKQGIILLFLCAFGKMCQDQADQLRVPFESDTFGPHPYYHLQWRHICRAITAAALN